MICQDILKELQKIAPFEYASEWDNVGLLVGSRESKIQTIMLALEPTEDVILQAVEAKADMLITHHPLIFKGQKQVLSEDFTGKRIQLLIENHITYAACHTNFDSALMAHEAAKMLGLKKKEILEPDHTGKHGCGMIGKFPTPITALACADMVKEVFHIQSVRLYGDEQKKVETCAVLPGSGADQIACAIEKNADLYITGDIKYHEGIEAAMRGLTVIDAGHYQMEKIFSSIMKRKLEFAFSEMKILCADETEPYRVV